MRRFAWLACAALLWGCAQADIGGLAPDANDCPGDPLAPEECNGVDDDCDGVVDDGFPNVGLDCEVGEGECAAPGKTVCDPEGGPGATVCQGDPGSIAQELCGNGADDDCDGLLDEGFANHGMPCSVGVGVCQRSGKLRCSDDALTLVCDQPPGTPVGETCGNAADDDCDGTVDEGFEALMTPCDGNDADLCTEGLWLCSGDGLGLVCSDPNDVDAEICNTLDDDCNPETPDGSQEPSFNLDCDGTVDVDLCKEGKVFCTGAGSLACNDPNDADPDICDNFDNDCNAGTADGAGDGRYGLACDGAGDTDVCTEGVYTACGAGGVLTCNDPVNDNLTNDAENCGLCGTVCENQHGTTSCVNSACDPNCSTGWQACGALKDGCGSLRDTNPSCSNPDIGEVRGDTGTDDIVISGRYAEAYFHADVTEPSFSDIDPTVRVYLYSPPGVNMAVCVRCENCNGAERCANYAGAGGVEYVEMSAEDELGDDTFGINIRVYFVSGDDTSCDTWTLIVGGNYPRFEGYICDG